MKRLFLLTIFLVPAMLLAQRLTIEPPQEVRAGVPFQLRYFVDADADPSDFHLKLPSGLRLLNSARKSSFSSTTIVNGRRTDERGTNLTLVVQAQHAGTFRVPAASLRLNDGRTITSNSFSFVAVDDDKPAPSHNGEPSMQPIGSRITENDAFVMASADRTGVLEQQPVLISLRLYTRVGVAVDNPMLAGSLPEVEGASIQNVSPGASQMDIVQNGGVSYHVRTIGRFMLIPSKAGTITLPASLQSLGDEVFYNDENLKEIKVLAMIPPTCTTKTFDGLDKTKVKVIVPAGTATAYKNATGWKNFNISDGTQAVSNVYAEEGQSAKIIENGQILILRGDKMYTLTGQEVR